MTTPPLYPLGSTVRLASGGPLMTVVSHTVGGYVTCRWFPSSDVLQEQAFQIDTLTSSNPIVSPT